MSVSHCAVLLVSSHPCFHTLCNRKQNPRVQSGEGHSSAEPTSQAQKYKGIKACTSFLKMGKGVTDMALENELNAAHCRRVRQVVSEIAF